MPEAAKALEAEWKKLEDKRAWLLNKVRSKREVMAEARKKGNTVHFGSLMDLCFEKHSEQSAENRKCKGRVVLRGSDQLHGHVSRLGDGQRRRLLVRDVRLS